MKRNILLAVTALMIALAMTACSPNANNQGPIIIGPSGNTNRPMSSSDAAEAFADNFSFWAVLANAAVSDNKATVDFGTNPHYYTDAEDNQWTVNDGRLEYTFSDAAAGSSVSLLSNGSMTSYTVKTIEPLTIAYSKGSYTLTIGETTAACDVTISADSVTINSMTQPSSISINGTTVAPTTPAYTLVGTETALKTAVAKGGEIAINGEITLKSQLSVAKDGTHIFGIADGAKITINYDAADQGDYGLISVTADNVSIEDLAIAYTGAATESRSTRILKAQYTADNQVIDGFSLNNVKFESGTIAGINLHGTTKAKLTDVSVNVTSNQNTALSITDSQNLTVSGGSYASAWESGDIQVNYASGDEFYRDKVSSVKFEGISNDTVILVSNPPKANVDQHEITVPSDFVRTDFVAIDSARTTYYNAPESLDSAMTMLNYFFSFGHKRVLVDVTALLSGDEMEEGVGSLSVKEDGINLDTSAGTLTLDLVAEDYSYCGKKKSELKVSGDITLTFKGTYDESSSKLTASTYSVSSDSLTFEGPVADGYKTATMVLADVSGNIVESKLSLDSLDMTAIAAALQTHLGESNKKTLEITSANGTYTTNYEKGTAEEDGSHAFGLATSGTVTVGEGTPFDFSSLQGMLTALGN